MANGLSTTRLWRPVCVPWALCACVPCSVHSNSSLQPDILTGGGGIAVILAPASANASQAACCHAPPSAERCTAVPQLSWNTRLAVSRSRAPVESDSVMADIVFPGVACQAGTGAIGA